MLYISGLIGVYMIVVGRAIVGPVESCGSNYNDVDAVSVQLSTWSA